MEETYKKSKGFAGQKGVHFQLDLVAMCLLNALRNHTNWKISTENPMGGKYDDIVVELDRETTVLIQAKHKESKKITKDQLLSANSKYSDFSLPKYFFSYEEVKRKFPRRTAIICTNTTINTKGLEDIITIQQAQPDSVLYHGRGCSFYRFNENILPELKKSALSYVNNNSPDKSIDKAMVTEENLKCFLGNLQFFSCYPCGDHLHEIIEQYLASLSWSSLCPNISSQEILRKVEDWFLQPMGEYLTEARTKAMLCEIRSDKYCDSLKDFKVSFVSNDLDLPPSGKIVHIEVKEGYLLQILKTYSALRGDKSRKLYVNPEDDLDVQRDAVEAFRLQRYKFLIIPWGLIKDEAAKKEITSKLKEILQSNEHKKVILLADTDTKLARQFRSERINHIHASLSFQDFSEDSQERLLRRQNIIFQGKRITLGVLLTRWTEDYTKSLPSAMLEELVKGTEMRVGVRPLHFDEDTARYYVSRRFQMKTNEETKTIRNILTEANLCDAKDKMIVISDSAGMGKSTVLINMAVTIKKTDPSLWVLKINLNDYTRVLRDCVKWNKKQITVAELLNSREGTKMTNELERFVFSMKQKVVLMLDGVDEISPDYTDLVLSLLSHCQKAPNFAKIFVTTRPHVALKLKEVALFQILPFTSMEQANFLTEYWMHNLRLSEEKRAKCKQYVEILLHKVSSWTGSVGRHQENLITDVPLQVRMLAEIFQENIKGQVSGEWEGCKEYLERGGDAPRLPEKFNIAELYDTFVEKKRDVFVEKGSSSGSVMTTPALLKQFELCLAYHRSLAMNTLLPKYKHLCKQVPEDGDMEEYILKIGIVQRLGDRIHFIHRTFAEYFVADSLVEELKLQNPHINLQRLVVDIILWMDEYKIVRTFLDILLHRVRLSPSTFKQYRSLKHGKANSNLIFGLAREGHVAILRLLLENVHFKVVTNRSIRITNWRLRIPFRKRNTLNHLKILVRQAGVNIKRDGKTPLHVAAGAGHLEMVDFLVKHGADVNVNIEDSETALHLATYSHNWKIVKYLVDHGADINVRSRRDNQVLHVAALLGTLDTVACLVEHGADVNMKNGKNDTALHVAVYYQRWDIVKYLIEHGADVNCQCEGDTLLLQAVKSNKMDVVERLVVHGANVNARDIKECSALHYATYRKDSSLIKYLVEHGADVNLTDNECRTALHYAVRHCDLGVVKFLLEHGADVNLRNNRNNTVLQLATFYENWHVVNYLIEHGVEVNDDR